MNDIAFSMAAPLPGPAPEVSVSNDMIKRGLVVAPVLIAIWGLETGYGAEILHRTGHSLGETVHGDGVNMDDYETHDDRRLLPGTGFTIEPGVYFDDFGVRTEINMVVGAREATVTGPLQTEILALI